MGTSINLEGYKAKRSIPSRLRTFAFTQNKSSLILKRYTELEEFLINQFWINDGEFHLKEVNGAAFNKNIKGSSVKKRRTLLYYLTIKKYILKHHVRAKLIQSADGFKLYNLAEIRFFLKQIDKKSNGAVITDDVWTFAKNQLRTEYRDSTCLENCCNMIADFEKLFPTSDGSVDRQRYRSDLEEFIRESKFEDFFTDEDGVVYVSTIHKSKGREFDHVYMMLDNVSAKTDEVKRDLYVGSGIHGASFIKPFCEDSWEKHQTDLAWMLLKSSIIIFEGWLEELKDTVFPTLNVKNSNFAPHFSLKTCLQSI